MRLGKGFMVMTGLIVLAGCSSLKHSDGYIKQPTVCVDKEWYGYHQGAGCPSNARKAGSDTTKRWTSCQHGEHCPFVAPPTASPASDEMAARLATLERERNRLADELEAARRQNASLSSRANDFERQLAERDRDINALHAGSGDSAALANQLAAANQRIAELEGQLAGRDQELAGLRGDLSAEMAKLKEAERGLIRTLRPQIKKGDITVDLNDERLLINLASGYLFASGADQLKPAGIEALQQVGTILKDYPEYNVAVDGHTDNVPIRGALKNTFPTNMELSEARAANAAKALEEGGLAAASTHGYADTKPKASNKTEAGRAKTRRVEVRVTK